MIEKKVIREKYASISDSELIAFAKNEQHLITDEAAIILADELNKRNLSKQHFEIETAIAESFEKRNDHFNFSYWSYAFDQKENRSTDAEIISGLIESGMEEQAAKELILLLGTSANERLKKAETERLIGSLILICGIAVTFLPLSMPANKLTYIIAWCAIIAGGLQLSKGIFGINRFKKIIRNISIEKNI